MPRASAVKSVGLVGSSALGMLREQCSGYAVGEHRSIVYTHRQSIVHCLQPPRGMHPKMVRFIVNKYNYR